MKYDKYGTYMQTTSQWIKIQSASYNLIKVKPDYQSRITYNE